MLELTENKLLISVLFFAFILRFWGADFGLPVFFTHTDETLTIAKARGEYKVDYKKGEALNIMHYVVQTIDAAVVENKISLIKSPSADRMYRASTLYIGRVLSAVLSTINVLFIFLIVRELFDEKLALLSALFLSITFVDVQTSHYLRQDVYTHFLGLLSIYLSILYITSNRPAHLMSAAFSAGLAMSIRLNGTLFLVPLLVFLIRQWAKKNIDIKGLFIKFVIIGFFSIVGFVLSQFEFFITAPVNIWPRLITEAMEIQNNAIYASAANGMSSFNFFFQYALKVGLYYPLFFASIAGAFFYLKSDYGHKLYVMLFPALYFVVIGTRSVRFDRLLTAITPFLAFFAAFFIYKLFTRRALAGSIVVILIFCVSLARIVIFDYYLTKKDTREVALEWLLVNVTRDMEVHFLGGAHDIGYHTYVAGYNSKLLAGAPRTKENWNIDNSLVVLTSQDIRVFENYRNADKYREGWEEFQKFLKRSRLVAKFKVDAFESDFIAPNYLEASSTVKYYHNPTIWVYSVGDINKGNESANF